MKKIIAFSVVLVFSFLQIACEKTTTQENQQLVHFFESKDTFILFQEKEKPVPIIFSSNDHNGLNKIAGLFQHDIQLLTGEKPVLINDEISGVKTAIIVGTIGKSKLIDQLVTTKKIDVSQINGKWESCLIHKVNNPFPVMEEALVIAGSDKRGTFYGLFELSRKMGVSPWYWWADVPITQQENIYVNATIILLTSQK